MVYDVIAVARIRLVTAPNQILVLFARHVLIVDNCSKCQKAKGDCPPCPRARCPEVKCPPATKCPACAPCPRTTCPPAVVKCKAEEVIPADQQLVRPYMAPLGSAFGSD